MILFGMQNGEKSDRSLLKFGNNLIGLGFFFLVLTGGLSAQPLRTPAPPKAPRIHGPRINGGRADRPFLYRIPCTGERPIFFTVENLPASLHLESSTGILQGRTPAKEGEYPMILKTANRWGSDQRKFKILVGNTIALTPPMGWSSWYAWSDRISDPLIRKTATAMIDSGVADYGYQYIGIDDCWMYQVEGKDPLRNGKPRSPEGIILPNKLFPDMKSLVDYIHSLGLKAGIYTSPGPYTCQVYTGSYRHEEDDARQFAAWGFDLLKYDWCSYSGVAEGPGRESVQAPFRKMGIILRNLDRDILFNICQYGKEEVWKWGADVGGQTWRTTGDLSLESGDRLPAFYGVARRNMQLSEFAGPGRWNDPDYLMFGYMADSNDSEAPAKKAILTPEEQYSYMSLWSLMAAPLFFSGDLIRLDPFTRNVLCNSEIIEVNQDPLGRQARLVYENEKEWILLKTMENGSYVLGMFNLSSKSRRISVAWKDLGLSERQKVRDLWFQKELGSYGKTFSTILAAHDVRVLHLQSVTK
jgi:alpha-galactosidase